MNDAMIIRPLKSQRPANQLLVTMVVIIAVASVILLAFYFLSGIIFGHEITNVKIGTGILSNKERAYFKLMQLFSQLSIFIVPALIISWLMTGNIKEWQGLNVRVSPVEILIVVVLAISLLELTSLTGIINSRMVLPDWLGWLERWMQSKENEASNLIRQLIYSSGTGGLIINILLLSVVPAAGEELMFRGVLQQIFKRWSGSGTVAVFITAFIFSVLHFQFYGFLPRFILGIVFGFLFLWSGSVILPFVAHMVNNLVPVIISHYTGWDRLEDSVNEFIPGGAGSVVIMIILPLALLYLTWYVINENKIQRGKT